MRKIVLFCVMLFSFAFGQYAHALMYNVMGIKDVPAGTQGWITDSTGCSVPQASSGAATFTAKQNRYYSCTFHQPVSWGSYGYLPAPESSPGWYLFIEICTVADCRGGIIPDPARNVLSIRPDRSLGAQTLDWGGITSNTNNFAVTSPGNDKITVCAYFRDGPLGPGGHMFAGDSSSEPWCKNVNGMIPAPLPPNPDINTCSINNDNPVTVDMGEINRAEISTAAGSGEVKHKSIPVWCYSDSGFSSMPVNLQFSYTPTTFVDGKAIQSSVPGVGISVGYDSKILVSNEVLNLNLPIGDSNMDFTFEAIRDSGVAVTDIETGPFTASGVLIMSLP